MAKAIHHLSPRAEKRFLAINCGAFSETLLANELFGHEKEAFTGARGVKKGLLEAASGGTVFLDENRRHAHLHAGEAPPRPPGTTAPPGGRHLRNPGGPPGPGRHQQGPAGLEAERGAFRQDLYYRINVVSLQVPTLAERPDDIPLLCQHFLRKFADLQGKQVAAISPEVMEILLNYEFPGNIRELENIIERAVTLCNGGVIDMSHLPLDFRQPQFQVQRHSRKEFHSLEENEKEYIAWVVKQVNGNKTRAAEILGIDRVSLWRRQLKRYELNGGS